ncbi:MAG TPA: acyl-CoA dehydrogenase family protein [Nocardioides sp.]|uniref:acyl-CoA dehydrogenase family protein n=1 Tax=Nocardioides sp. TaxID=35761 RepID=UPI002E312986|nr:acyl-CoA dehydrogenase family protein [Nocardioides sp.]HEX5090581.1 acyl-CoA dehydrogenase family protein [Nocardioides sp.]
MAGSMTPAEAAALGHRIGRETAAVHAADVDVQARFPKETIDAFRAEGLLGALVPTELGGLGHDLRTAAEVVRTVARYCASSAMILAMHHIQVACLVRHGRSEALRDYARRVAAEQLLLASATTEIGIGGNTRSSSCFVERDPDDPTGGFTLTKQAPVISYGQYADSIFTTARRNAASPAGDQVLVVCEAGAVTLEPLSGWDTMGFRGTCSLGFTMRATGDAALILDDPFGDISAQTMLPTAHLLWSSLWLGLAEEASWRAQRFVQNAARKDPGTVPPGAARLAALMVTRQEFAATVDSLMTRYLSIIDDAEATSAVDFMVAINTLKISASTEVVDVVNQALLICGIQGYREDTEYSLGRILRDAHGAAVMVNNDRIAANTAQLALVQRES